jgi:serine/threonine protein kinase
LDHDREALMTRDSSEGRHKMAALLEEALESGALVFSEPLLDALAVPEDFSGRVRSEHGASYDIERKLGRGGMATVYLARDPKHERSIAIKVLHAELTERVGAERFVREIRLTARLQHPHVLGLLDSGVFDRDAGVLAGRPYYVMPYVEGESLRARLTREGALQVRDAMRVLRDVADALCYAHEQGVVHRDIKPENILLSSGHAVVADFGIAKAIAAASRGDRPEGVSPNELKSTSERSSSAGLTRSSTLIGTLAYMAPEQADVEMPVDHRADLYAWGVVAYEILSGQHPFAARRSAAELLSARMDEAPRPIRDVAPSVSPALGALVMRCLAKAPSDRPSSAMEVVAALDAAAIGARVDRPSVRAMSRRARLGVTAALGTVLVLVAAILYARLGSHPTCSFFDRSLWQQLARRQPVVVWTGKQAMVVGTCDPALDVAAVQTAVDRAETVVLDGHFSFRQPPTKPVDPNLSSSSPATAPFAQVLVSKTVTILGTRDTSGGMTTIDGGTIPFYIDAAGARVTIRNLRFVRPIDGAIAVHAAHDLDIDLNRIEGLMPFKGAGAAIMINASGNIPRPSGAGSAGDVSGSLTISRNDIDLADGPTGVYALGVAVFSAGQSHGAEVNLDINGNHIRNTTSAITVRRVIGHIRLFDNVVQTGFERVSGDYEAIRLANTGSYWMANNTIECRWANCIGIAVFSQSREWPIQSATIEHNQVKMSPPPGPVSADSSAAIEIRGFAHSNVVQYNTIRGRAQTALAISMFKGGYPEDNAFIDNDLQGFDASLASTLVGSGVLRTRLVHPGTVVDRGVSTNSKMNVNERN